MKLNLDAAAQRTNAAPVRQTQQAEQEQDTQPLTAAERRQQAREDKLELSQEALAYLQSRQAGEDPLEETAEPLTPEEKREQAKAQQLKAAGAMLDMLKQQSAQMKEQSEKQADALKKSLDKMKKCMRIARNISKGHKVPPEDEKYLLENDSKAYMLAMVLRMMEEEKKKVKSELDDEDRKGESQSGEYSGPAGAMEAASPEAGADISVEASVE